MLLTYITMTCYQITSNEILIMVNEIAVRDLLDLIIMYYFFLFLLTDLISVLITDLIIFCY
jgi:hypothetical protein